MKEAEGKRQGWAGGSAGEHVDTGKKGDPRSRLRLKETLKKACVGVKPSR